jgi:hypothetical protein
MTKTDIHIKTHPTENDIADYLARSLTAAGIKEIEEHMAGCDECLAAMVSAYESAGKPGNKNSFWRKLMEIVKKLNIYLILAILSFALSFITPRHFIQLLVATLLLGIKWIVDAKSTKMLVMIYEAWKHGGEKGASQVLNRIGQHEKVRF